jgi:poly-gamma-glutamate synthesis protein (capsule biosynthesis protein)
VIGRVKGIVDASRAVTLFLAGDVMTGRGVDQALPCPSDPQLHEGYVKNALEYLRLAEARSGPIPRPMDFGDVWGDVIDETERLHASARIVNLETAVTASDDAWPGKGINYRMHPGNVGCLVAAKIDCCVLANNHVLDWGYAGLQETLDTLRGAGIKTVGAGFTIAEAAAPAMIDVAGSTRVAVFAFGSASSGIPDEWAASSDRPGVNVLPDLSDDTVRDVARQVREVKRPGTIVVASLHWGSNWGYGIPRSHRVFAHRVVDEAGVDVVHGHSSHHPRAIAIYGGRPILYGCGDLIDDYEGIPGHEEFRSELGLMYFPTIDADTGQLVRFTMTPTHIRRFRVTRASPEQARWLADMLDREGARFGTRVQRNDATLTLCPTSSHPRSC